MNQISSDLIKQLAHETGFDACGITVPFPLKEAEQRFSDWVGEGKHGEMRYLENYCERAKKFWDGFPNAKSIIVLGVNYYSNSHPNPLPSQGRGKGEGRVARYAWGKDYHHVIREKIEALKSKILERVNCEIRFEHSVDTKPLLEKPLAVQAGLGFIGKQTQLLSLQFGPWLFLSELVTDLELESDTPFKGSCGTCRLCIDECPTEAIEETGGIDARKCVAYLTIEHKSSIPEELRPKIGNWVFGCDECLSVCPYTSKQKEAGISDLKSESGFGSQLDLRELFDIPSQGAYERKFKGTAILRANRKQLIRNVCVVLGNSKDRAAIPILEKALSDSSELVREHAHWALEQLGRKVDVLERLTKVSS
ncbi:MAG: tRNA epoxyqueuosine(34) reductase QueG [Candidatus Omnitrophica bacterium]|nr:tRNA epoxyqueuosine(34) reductase QueG [Candidatus Omnitrophota bacterium]